MDTILDILDELKPGVDWRGRTDLVDGRELDSLTIARATAARAGPLALGGRT